MSEKEFRWSPYAVWSEDSVSECPGCGATVGVGIMSLCATCKYCGMYYVEPERWRGWYFSREHFESGGERIG